MESQKVTARRETATKRRYDDACAATHAIEIFGERWALPVTRELMLGPRRFGEIKASISGISANVLQQRLEGLEAVGVVRRRRLPPPASVQVYELTQWGYEASPIFQVMGRWGARSPHHDPTAPFSPVSLMLSFRTMLDPARAADFTGRLGFVLGAQTFLFAIDRGAVSISREITQADATFTATPSPLAAAAYVDRPLAELEAEGAVHVEGDRAVAERFLTLFLKPVKVGDPQ